MDGRMSAQDHASPLASTRPARIITPKRQPEEPGEGHAGSIAAGKKLYDTQCATCHGDTGKGDGKMAASIPAETVRPHRRQLEARLH